MEKNILYILVFSVILIFIILLVKKGGLKDWDERLKFSKEVELDIKFPMGANAKIVCPDGMSISENSFKYGNEDGSCVDSNDQVINAILSKCYGKNTCDFILSDSVFNVKNECAKNTEKMLWGKYKCKRF